MKSKSVATKSITEVNFWKFDRRVRELLKSYGYTPVNDLVGSIHAAAKQFYADDGAAVESAPSSPKDNQEATE